MLKRTLLLVGASLVAVNVAAQGLFDDNEARRRIDALRSQMLESQRALEERVAKAEAASADRNALLDISSQLDALRSEIARMRGQIEVLANQNETAERRQKDLYLDIDTRLRKLEQAKEQQAAAPEKPPAGGEEPTPAETRAYQAALDQFKLGNYALAVAAMQ